MAASNFGGNETRGKDSPEGGVNKALYGVQERIEELSDALNTLEANLGPMLIPVPSSKDDASDTATVRCPQSAIAHRIDAHAFQIDTLTERVRQLNRLLDIS